MPPPPNLRRRSAEDRAPSIARSNTPAAIDLPILWDEPLMRRGAGILQGFGERFRFASECKGKPARFGIRPGSAHSARIPQCKKGEAEDGAPGRRWSPASMEGQPPPI